jgi:class 3 adenylate cyclase
MATDDTRQARGPAGDGAGPPGDPGQVERRCLLLTDLVDSTRLVAELGDARGAALMARHDRVARDLLVAHAGREIDKSEGFLHLFPTAAEAAAYALALHAALSALAAEEGLPLQARVGLHSGEVLLV